MAQFLNGGVGSHQPARRCSKDQEGSMSQSQSQSQFDQQPVQPTVRVAGTDPLARALDLMVSILFKPFRFGRWFGLGFLFFLSVNLFTPVAVIAAQLIGPVIEGFIRNDWGSRILD